MVITQFNSLTALQPIRLNYTYNSTEPLQQETQEFNNGLRLLKLNGTKRYQDVSFNNETCLVLTSAVSLSSLITPRPFNGLVFGTIYLQPRNTNIYYLQYNSNTNTVGLALTGSLFYIKPIPETNEVEIIVDKKFLQVSETYPYTVTFNSNPLLGDETYRQRFIYTIHNNTISFRTLTNTGYRYLTLSTDGLMRATGIVLNEAVVSDYVFKFIPVAFSANEYGFIPNNEFVTYFFDFENATNNRTLEINKKFTNIPTNFLISFPFTEVLDQSETTINIANLKTIATPAGGLATIDNSYTKQPITS